MLVGALDESLKVRRTPVGRVGTIRERPVISPVPATAEIAGRHDLDRRDPELREMVELERGSGKRSLWGKSADMKPFAPQRDLRLIRRST
jgi:hypothetical protein